MEGVTVSQRPEKLPQELDDLRQRRLAYFVTATKPVEKQENQANTNTEENLPQATSAYQHDREPKLEQLQRKENVNSETYLSERSGLLNGNINSREVSSLQTRHDGTGDQIPVTTLKDSTRKTERFTSERKTKQKENQEHQTVTTISLKETKSDHTRVENGGQPLKTSSFFFENPEDAVRQSSEVQHHRDRDVTPQHPQTSSVHQNLFSSFDHHLRDKESKEIPNGVANTGSGDDGYSETVERLIRATKKELLGASIDDDIWNQFQSDRNQDIPQPATNVQNDESRSLEGIRQRISSFESMSRPSTSSGATKPEQKQPRYVQQSLSTDRAKTDSRSDGPQYNGQTEPMYSTGKYTVSRPNERNMSDYSEQKRDSSLRGQSVPGYREQTAGKYNGHILSRTGEQDVSRYNEMPVRSHRDQSVPGFSEVMPDGGQHKHVQHKHGNKYFTKSGDIEDFFQSTSHPIPPLKHLNLRDSQETEAGALLQKSATFSDLDLSTHRPQDNEHEVTLVVESSNLKLDQSLTNELRTALGEEKFQQFLTKSAKDLNDLQQERLSERSTGRKEKQHRAGLVTRSDSVSGEKKREPSEPSGLSEKTQEKNKTAEPTTPHTLSARDGSESVRNMIGQYVLNKPEKKLTEKLTTNPAYKPKKIDTELDVNKEPDRPVVNRSVPNLNLNDTNSDPPRPKLNRPKHEPFNIYSDKQGKQKTDDIRDLEDKFSPNSAPMKNYEQVTVPRNVVFSSSEIYSQAYGSFPGYPPGMPGPVYSGVTISPHQVSGYAHTSMASYPQTSQSSAFVYNTYQGSYELSEDNVPFDVLLEAASRKSSINKDSIPIPHPPTVPGPQSPVSHDLRSPPVVAQVAHLPHPPVKDKKPNMGITPPTGYSVIHQDVSSSQNNSSPSNAAPLAEMTSGYLSPVTQGYPGMAAGYSYPYPVVMMAPHPPAEPQTPTEAQAVAVQTDDVPDEKHDNDTLVEESTFTSVSQIVQEESVTFPHPPATKKEVSHKTTRKMSKPDSKRHIDGIRQHHEQKRAQQQEAGERLTDEQILEKQRKFAKASLDRYFSSLENLYKSSLKAQGGSSKSSESSESPEPESMDQALKKVSEDIEQILGPVDDNDDDTGDVITEEDSNYAFAKSDKFETYPQNGRMSALSDLLEETVEDESVLDPGVQNNDEHGGLVHENVVRGGMVHQDAAPIYGKVSDNHPVHEHIDHSGVLHDKTLDNDVVCGGVVLDKVVHGQSVHVTVNHKVLYGQMAQDDASLNGKTDYEQYAANAALHDKVAYNQLIQNRSAPVLSDMHDKNNGDSDIENETVVTGASIQVGGVTERLNELGIDTKHLKSSSVSENEGTAKGVNDNLFSVHNKHEKVAQKKEKRGKLLLVCPECEGFNKEYMSWCTHCGEMIIGVEPVLVSKNREGKIRKIPLSKDKSESEVLKTVNVSKFTEAKQPEMIPVTQSNYIQQTQSGSLALDLDPKPVVRLESVEHKMETSPIKSDGKDSGRPSSDEQDLLQNCYRTEQEIAEICENITDPIVKGFIKSHFAKKRQIVLDSKASPRFSPPKAKVSSKASKSGEITPGSKPSPKPKPSSKTTPRSKSASQKVNKQSDSTKTQGESKVIQSQEHVPIPNRGQGENVGESSQGQLNVSPEFSMVPPGPQLYDDGIAESIENNFLQGFPSKDELALQVPADSMDFSQLGSVDFSNDFSQSLDDKNTMKDEEKKEKVKARRKKKGHGAIDVEVFGYEESRESRNSSRGQRMVPILKLVGSSDEEDESVQSDSRESPVAADSVLDQASVGHGAVQEEEMVPDDRKTSPVLIPENQSNGHWQQMFEPVEEGEPQLPDDEEVIREEEEEIEENQPFLELLAGQGAKPKKRKNSQGPSPSKSKPVIKSKVRSSIEGPGYQRKWARSSIAWSSFNPGELRTSSSLRSSFDGSVGHRPVSTNQETREPEHHSAREASPVRRGLEDTKRNRPSSADLYKRKQKQRSSSATTKSKKHNHNGLDLDEEMPLDTVEHRLPRLHVQELLQDHIASPKSTYDKYIEMTPRIQEGKASVWQCLPDEILLHILAYVDQSDLTRCAQVCQQFYRVAMDESLWKYITIKKKRDLDDFCLMEISKRHPISLALIQCHGDKVTAKGLRDMFRECSDSLKELNISCCSRGALTGDSLLLHAAARCHILTHIDTSWCNVTDSGLIAISNSCHRLESLCINGCQAISNEGFETVIKRHGQSLRYLEIFGCFNITPRGLRCVSNNCINLLTLNLGQCHKVTDSCVAQLSSSLGRVEMLDLRGCKQIKDNCIRRVVKNCGRLKNISLANCPNITDVSVLEISTYLSDIRSIDLCGCKNVTDGGVRALANTCSNLRNIDISSTGCTHRSVSMIANFCSQRLESLKLNFLADITEACLIKLAKHCRRLKTVHLYGCTSARVTDKVKEERPTFTIEM